MSKGPIEARMRFGRGWVTPPSEAHRAVAHQIDAQGVVLLHEARQILKENGASDNASTRSDFLFQLDSGRFRAKTGIDAGRILYQKEVILFDQSADPEEIEWKLENAAQRLDNIIQSRRARALNKETSGRF